MSGILITLLTFLCMECVTWLTHKYVMHGFLWELHEDHHQPGYGVFEKNDWFFVIFAVPAIILIWTGFNSETLGYLTYVGAGITAYGAAYFVIHEIVIHQRIKIFTRSNNCYIRAIRKAHKVHHKHLDKADGECFGMLWVPLKYFKEARQAQI